MSNDMIKLTSYFQPKYNAEGLPECVMATTANHQVAHGEKCRSATMFVRANNAEKGSKTYCMETCVTPTTIVRITVSHGEECLSAGNNKFKI
jgi:hypothetical protein